MRNTAVRLHFHCPVAPSPPCPHNARRAAVENRRGMERATAAAADIKPVVIAPTFNNAGTVAGVLGRVASMGLPIIVVNDGSTDSTSLILRCWLKEHPEYK